MDKVNNPPHYLIGGLEVIDILKAKLTPEEFKGYLIWSLYAYLFRHQHKGQAIDDLNKALWYLKRLIKENEGHFTEDEAKDCHTIEMIEKLKMDRLSRVQRQQQARTDGPYTADTTGSGSVWIYL